MGMDRNTVIGFVLLALLFFGYFYYSKQGQLALEKTQQHLQDSINRTKPKVDTNLAKINVKQKDSSAYQNPTGFLQDSVAVEKTYTLENDLLKITFTNKGGQPKTVELKKFKRFDGTRLLLDDGSFNKITYAINTSTNQTAQTADLLFKTQHDSSNNKQGITFILQNSNGQIIQHQYTLPADSYMLDFDIKLSGADKLITQNKINLIWQAQAPQVEKDLEHEKQQSHIAFVKDGDYDFENLGTGSNDKSLIRLWIGLPLSNNFLLLQLLLKTNLRVGIYNGRCPQIPILT